MKRDYAERFYKVVDLLRVTGGYTAVLSSGTLYDITSDIEHELSVNDYLTLDGVAVRVVLVTGARTFQIDAFDGVVAPAGVWKAMAPYAHIGTRKTINTMMLLRNSYEYQYQKYPLIALRLPFTLSTRGGMKSFPANILIATFTNKTQNPDERLANTFRPILYPLRDEFLAMLVRSGEFLGFDKDFDEIDRMFYGTESGDVTNIKNVFSDPLDAIEIKGLQLNYLEDECSDIPLPVPPATVEEQGFEYGLEQVMEG